MFSYFVTLYVPSLPSTGFVTLYKKALCFGMDDDGITPQTKANGKKLDHPNYGGFKRGG